MTGRARLEAWLGARSTRERRVLAAAAACTVGMGALVAVRAAQDDLATLRARVNAHERELGEVRRLASTLRARPSTPAAVPGDDTPLLGRLEAAAADTVGRERIASMTPVTTPAAGRADAVALRLAGASLAEVVGLLHGLATGAPPLAVTRLELRKRPDDPARFDALVEVSR